MAQGVAGHRAFASVSEEGGGQCFHGNIATLIRHILGDVYAPHNESRTHVEEELCRKNLQRLGIPFYAYEEDPSS